MPIQPTEPQPRHHAPGLQEPVPRGLQRVLRTAVLDHALAEHRHTYTPLLHVGEPRVCETTFPVRPEEPTDHALRTDIVAAMRHRVRTGIGPGASRTSTNRPIVWLTRPGPLERQDLDAEWLGAARQAFAEAGAPLIFVVANRHGWADPRSGVSRTWQRLRPRSGPEAR